MRAGIVVVVLGIVMWSTLLGALRGDGSGDEVPASTEASRPGATAAEAAEGAFEQAPVETPVRNETDVDGSPTPTATPTPELDQGPDQQTEQAHVVEAGDTMVRIAERYGVSLRALIDANPQVSDPTRIEIGQRINIPD